MSRPTSTLIYWIRRYLAQFLAQIAKIMATFIASSLVLWLVVSSQLGWAADKNAVSAATRDHQRSADLTMQALAAAVEPTEVLWLKTDDQPFLSLYRPAVDAPSGTGETRVRLRKGRSCVTALVALCHPQRRVRSRPSARHR